MAFLHINEIRGTRELYYSDLEVARVYNALHEHTFDVQTGQWKKYHQIVTIICFSMEGHALLACNLVLDYIRPTRNYPNPTNLVDPKDEGFQRIIRATMLHNQIDVFMYSLIKPTCTSFFRIRHLRQMYFMKTLYKL